jgi:hypothetical protein
MRKRTALVFTAEEMEELRRGAKVWTDTFLVAHISTAYNMKPTDADIVAGGIQQHRYFWTGTEYIMWWR